MPHRSLIDTLIIYCPKADCPHKQIVVDGGPDADAEPVPTPVIQAVSPGKPRPILTDRQREVAKLLAQDYSSKEVAKALGLSVRTVDSHRAEIFHRLDIKGIGTLTKLALRWGWIRADFGEAPPPQ